MAGPVAKARENIGHLGADTLGLGEQNRRVGVALQGYTIAHARHGLVDVDGPVQTNRRRAGIGDGFQPGAAAFGEHDTGHVAVRARLQIGDDALHIGQRELAVVGRRQHAAPGIEDLDCLGPGGDLRVEISRRRARQYVEQLVQSVGLVEHQRLEMFIIFRRPALDDIGRQRPRAAGKADQRRLAVELAPDQLDGRRDIAELVFDVRHGQLGDGFRRTHRMLELRAFAGHEMQAQAHGLGDSQDVREQNRCIQIEAPQRLQRDLAGQLRVLAQVEKAAGLLAQRSILRQVTTGLAHEPDRGRIDGLARQRAQETIVGHERPVAGG